MTIATLKTTSEDVVKALYENLPNHYDVYNTDVDPTPESANEKNSTWFVLRRCQFGLGHKLCQRMSERLPLSKKQWYWAIKIAGESLQPKTTDVTTVDTTKIKDLFDNAISDRLKNPSVHLRLIDGSIVVVKRAGNRTRNRENIGTLVVADDGRYPTNKFYGRIGHNGEFRPTRKCNNAIVAKIQEFAENPADVAAQYGRLTGNCCFCRKALTDTRSTKVGYGPVCARNFNLPWG